MSVCHHCKCCVNAADKPEDVSDELDEAAHAIADAMGKEVYYSRRGRFGGSRVYIGGGGAQDIPLEDCLKNDRFGSYLRTVKLDDRDHIRPYVGVSFEVHYMSVETAEAMFRWLFNRERTGR